MGGLGGGVVGCVGIDNNIQLSQAYNNIYIIMTS